MKIGICAWVLPVDVLHSFAIARDLSLHGVVIDYEEALRAEAKDRSDRCERYKEKSIKHQIEIPTLALNHLCSKGMTQKINEGYAKELLHHSIETAVALGASKIQVPSFMDNLICSESDLIQTIEVLKFACKVAEEQGISVGTESVMTIEQHKEVYKAIDSKALMTIFDTQNPWRMMNQDGVRIAEYMLPYVGELHGKDSYSQGPSTLQLGQGDVKYKEIMSLFEKAGYNQWVQLESSYNCMHDYKSIIKEDIEQIKALFVRKSHYD